MNTYYYKMRANGEEDRLLNDLRKYAESNDIGIFGNPYTLNFADPHSVYFSFAPCQNSCQPAEERNEGELLIQFERRLRSHGVRWKKFDLPKILGEIRV